MVAVHAQVYKVISYSCNNFVTIYGSSLIYLKNNLILNLKKCVFLFIVVPTNESFGGIYQTSTMSRGADNVSGGAVRGLASLSGRMESGTGSGKQIYFWCTLINFSICSITLISAAVINVS